MDRISSASCITSTRWNAAATHLEPDRRLDPRRLQRFGRDLANGRDERRGCGDRRLVYRQTRPASASNQCQWALTSEIAEHMLLRHPSA